MTYPQRFTIAVTAEHLANGRRGPHASIGCPVALAVKAALPDAEMIVVGTDSVSVDRIHIYRLPPAVVVNVRRFDMQAEVSPYDAELTRMP